MHCIVASTAVLAGCGSQAQPSPSVAIAEPLAIPPLPPPSAARAAEPTPEPTLAPVAQAAPPREDPSLVALRDELRAEKLDAARAKMAHYRPLCDKDGYPLVGNMVRKSPKPELQPSELCAVVREGAGRR